MRGLGVEVGDATAEGVGPVGDVDVEGGFDLGFVEHGIGWTLDGTWVFVAVAGTYVARGGATIGGNHLGEVVPRTDAFGGVVIDAGLGAVELVDYM